MKYRTALKESFTDLLAGPYMLGITAIIFGSMFGHAQAVVLGIILCILTVFIALALALHAG